jgi:hypothetical protein
MNTEENVNKLREMICHENDLLNHRMTWMWTFQGFLFAALAFAWNVHKFPVVVFCFLGLVSSISFGYSFHIAHLAIGDLTIQAKRRENSEGTPVIGREGHFTVLLPWRLLPWIMGIVWVVLGVAKFVI